MVRDALRWPFAKNDFLEFFTRRSSSTTRAWCRWRCPEFAVLWKHLAGGGGRRDEMVWRPDQLGVHGRHRRRWITFPWNDYVATTLAVGRWTLVRHRAAKSSR